MPRGQVPKCSGRYLCGVHRSPFTSRSTIKNYWILIIRGTCRSIMLRRQRNRKVIGCTMFFLRRASSATRDTKLQKMTFQVPPAASFLLQNFSHRTQDTTYARVGETLHTSHPAFTFAFLRELYAIPAMCLLSNGTGERSMFKCFAIVGSA